MIENAQQYEITKSCLANFVKAVEAYNIEDVVKQGINERLAQAELAGLMSEVDVLEKQILVYENAELIAENIRIRAALANSDQPCVYCSLSKEDWNKCRSGFPGCGRGDDATGCEHFGAAMEVDDLRAQVERLRERVVGTPGCHRLRCPKYHRAANVDAVECTCGLDALLADTKGE